MTIVEDKLAVLEEKLAEETEEKERYIELYEAKCLVEEELNVALKNKCDQMVEQKKEMWLL